MLFSVVSHLETSSNIIRYILHGNPDGDPGLVRVRCIGPLPLSIIYSDLVMLGLLIILRCLSLSQCLFECANLATTMYWEKHMMRSSTLRLLWHITWCNLAYPGKSKISKECKIYWTLKWIIWTIKEHITRLLKICCQCPSRVVGRYPWCTWNVILYEWCTICMFVNNAYTRQKVKCWICYVSACNA